MNKFEKEALAYLETLASFGGTMQQSRELAQKGIDKLKEISAKEREQNDRYFVVEGDYSDSGFDVAELR